MEKTGLKESLRHGTPEFPVAVYNMKFDSKQQLLASLHYHNEFELLVATKGGICVQIEEKNYYLSEGEGIFINSGSLHTITAGDSKEETRGFIAVVFDYSVVCSQQEATFNKYIRPLIKGTMEVQPLLERQLSGMLVLICKKYEENSFGNELYIKHCLLQVVYRLIKGATNTDFPVQSTKSILVKEVLEFIKEHYSEQISLKDMAEHVHMSKEYLCRVFRALSDLSPVEYLNRYRIQQSTVLLLQDDMKISDIALACGFNHSSYFGKLFFHYTGCTPSEYRKKKAMEDL